MKRDNLSLITLTEEQHSRTCGYWYLVQQRHAAYTAFAERNHLIAWMEERGLELTEEMPEHGQYSWQYLKGEFREECHGSYDEFFALQGKRTRQLSNADYTMGIITRDEDGLRTVHYLNPNCRDRPVYDYFESRALYG